MIKREIDSLVKAQGYLKVAYLFGFIAAITWLARGVVVEHWATTRDLTACIPAETDSSFPMVYQLNSSHPVDDRTKMTSFIEKYVHLTEDEQIVDYTRVTQDSRYDKTKLSSSLWQATGMSLNKEKTLNMKKYADSYEVYRILDQGNVGWVFLIDSILTQGVEESGYTVVVVRGHYQQTFDRVKLDLPAQLWGYKEIRYFVQQGSPVFEGEGVNQRAINRWGYYVAWSMKETIPQEVAQRLRERDSRYYMKAE